MKASTAKQIEAMKKQTIGVEVEMYNITRHDASKVAAEFFGTGNYRDTAYTNGYYTWSAWDSQGREWKFQRDCSIEARHDSQKCELVTPILRYEDIETLMGLLRKLRKNGARSNPKHGCGVHIHIGADGHTPQSLRNLANLMASHESLLIEAIDVDEDRLNNYCRTVSANFLKEVNKEKPKTMEEFERVWYNSQGFFHNTHEHYNHSRYHILNLHATFTKGTIEFRCFQFRNPTGKNVPNPRIGGIHCGELKSYIQLCLALSQTAKDSRTISPKEPQHENPKFAMRTWLMRMGFMGEEFATARKILMRNLKGNAAFRFGKNIPDAA